ncbi:MAG: PQQ-dependent sugar dehydrogenase [Rhodoglobus sp.]
MRILSAAVVVAVLAGCSAAPTTPTPTPDRTATPSAPSPTPALAPTRPDGTPTVIASGLQSPWSMVRLRSGSTLISERDPGVILELTASGTIREVGVVADSVHDGEGGLLGLTYVRSRNWLFAYLTTATDNRIVRYDLDGAPGSYSLGVSTVILSGLAKAGNHNGGRIKIGPDGLLYATVGDAGNPDRAQDLTSNNGKILRLELDGSVPTDNPLPGSLIYSLGHRNPQGIAWDSEGQLWAAEFGQDTWDEFNRIEPSGNYGWPIVEGAAGDPAFIDPVYQWPTDDASPSGLAFVDGTFLLAALRGQRLWAINPGVATTATEYYTGAYGRLRDVVAGPDGTAWVLTNNTDGRGNPVAGDDRILQVDLVPLG